MSAPTTRVPSETASDERAGPFRPGVVIGLVFVAVFALSAMGVLIAYAPDLRDGDDGQSHALSKSAVGYAGVVRLLGALDRPPLLARGSGGVDPASLTIVTPVFGVDRDPIHDIAWDERTVLYVLPKWQTAPDNGRPGWVRQGGRIDPQLALRLLPAAQHRPYANARDGPKFRLDPPMASTLTMREVSGPFRPALKIGGGQLLGRTDRPIDHMRVLSGEGWVPVVTDQAGRGLVVVHENTGAYVLAEPDLLNTQGMADPGRARAAVAMLTMLAGDGRLIFDLTAAGFSRPRSALRMLLEPPLLGFTVCLFAAFLLVGWGALVRFGPHRRADRAVALGKQALADNTAALIALAGKEHRLAGPYARLVRASALKVAAAPSGLTEARQTALLDRLAEAGGSDQRWAALNAQALGARTPRDLMALARTLKDWKTAVTKGRP